MRSLMHLMAIEHGSCPRHTHIVIAPTGAGKSTLIRALAASGAHFTHVDRDVITHQIENTNRRAVWSDIVLASRNLYYSELRGALSSDALSVVVDYPPFVPSWAPDCCEMSRLFGRFTSVTGIVVLPAHAYQRVVHRNVGDTPLDMTAWAATFRRFPRQFLDAVACADDGILLANAYKGRLFPVARWKLGQLTDITNISIFTSFAVGAFSLSARSSMPNCVHPRSTPTP